MSLHKQFEKLLVVTGGAGCIGSNVISELNRRGIDRIVIVDNLGSTSKWKNLVGKRFHELLHKSQLFDWLQGRESEIEAIVHLGACSSTVEQDASYLLENNYRYTRRLAEWSIQHQVRFVYASSAATYGDGKQGFQDSHEKIQDLKPLNMYGYSKHLVDLWLYQEKLLDSVVGLKYFNVFGPNEWHKGRMASAICHLLPQVQEKGVVQLFGSDSKEIPNGEQKRDFVYVRDAARMTCDLLFSKASGIFNIGSGRASSWNELAYAIFAALKRAPHIEYIPMPADLVGKYQDYTCADMKKYEHVVPNFKMTPFSEAVQEYVLQYLLKGEYA